jgi:hypothetical protein
MHFSRMSWGFIVHRFRGLVFILSHPAAARLTTRIKGTHNTRNADHFFGSKVMRITAASRVIASL